MKQFNVYNIVLFMALILSLVYNYYLTIQIQELNNTIHIYSFVSPMTYEQMKQEILRLDQQIILN
jgi:hypothetical protein